MQVASLCELPANTLQARDNYLPPTSPSSGFGWQPQFTGRSRYQFSLPRAQLPLPVPRGTPVGSDTAMFKRFESQFRYLCAILGKSLWPAVSAGASGQPIMKLAHKCWRGSRGLPSSAGKYWFPSLPGLPSCRRLPWCSPCGTSHPGVSPSPERPKSPPFSAGCPQHPHPLPELAQGIGVFSPPCRALWEAEGVTGCPTPHRHPGDNGGGGGRCGHQGALLRAVPGHEQEGTALRFGESRGSCWGRGTNGAGLPWASHQRTYRDTGSVTLCLRTCRDQHPRSHGSLPGTLLPESA